MDRDFVRLPVGGGFGAWRLSSRRGASPLLNLHDCSDRCGR